MFRLYLTPASIAYLTEFILALSITLFLLNRLRTQRTRSLFLLTAFFAAMTVFIGLLVFNAALLPYPRLLTVFAENAFLGLALVALNAFAYHFPERYPQHKWEMRIALVFSFSYFFWEVGFMIFRYVSLLGQGNVFIRPPLVAYSIPIVVLFAPFGFLRQTLAADPRPVAWWRKLWKPEGKGAQGARNFALVLGVPVVLGIINALVFFGVSLTIIHAAVSIGILIMLWLLVNNYVNFIPGGVHVTPRLSILMLTLFLAMFGTVGWLIAPSYVSTFQPNLRDHQTLRFSPNASGGYEVSEVDFHFESALGEKGNQRVEFTFPFYGETYTEIYISEPGSIGLGQPPQLNNLQAPTARTPTIFPLLIDLISNPTDPDSGLYVSREPERLIVTWNRLLNPSQPETHYTFQTILYTDGTFEFTYNDLPQHILFHPNAVPSDDPWMRGAVAGHGEPLHEPSDSETVDLIALSRNGDSPLLENFHSAFRRYLHTFMAPVAWVVIGGSLLILLAIPLLLRSSIARPLEALTSGVRRMGAGEIDITIPIQSEDEIGFLTGAFNTMSGALDDHVRNLETRVADRTADLLAANVELRKLSVAVEQSPSVIVIANPQAEIEYVNESFTISTGYTFEEVKGRNPRILQSGQTPPGTYKVLWETLKAGKTWRGEFINRRKNGEIYWEFALIAPIYNVEGNVTHFVAVKEDITERKKLEEALRFSEEKFFKAFHSSPDSITITRMSDGGFVEVNEGFSRVTGYSREEALNPAASALQIWITPQDRDSFLQALQRDSVVRSAEYNYRTKSGEIRTGLLSAEIIQLGGEPHIVSVIHDITERKNAEDALKESEGRFRKSLEASPTPIAVADHTGKLIFLNQNFIDTYGYTIQDIPTVGQWMLQAYPDPEYRDLYLQQWGQDSEYAVKNNTVTPLRECQVTCKSGEVKTVEITAYFEKELFVGHFQDITEHKQAERQIRQAQAQIVEQQRAVAAFQERKRLARDLHDSLNQSIHSLILFSETLVAAIEKKNLGHAKHLVEQVQESARQSLKETRLLLFELQTAGQGRSVNLIRDLEERFAKVESYAGIQSKIIQKGSLRHIPAAWHENLYWITIEALNNAIKHAQARKITIEIHATPKQVELTVTDNGRGLIPSKVVSGGMGLETMRERARQLGGELTIESEPSQGTCVRFRATIKAKQDEQH